MSRPRVGGPDLVFDVVAQLAGGHHVGGRGRVGMTTASPLSSAMAGSAPDARWRLDQGVGVAIADGVEHAP